MKVIYKVQLAPRKKWKMISQQKWGILLFIYRIFPGTKENVFIKGLLAYKYKHINVGHWGHLAKLFASNLSCLLVLSPGDPSGIPWRVCSPTGRDCHLTPGPAQLHGHTAWEGLLPEVGTASHLHSLAVFIQGYWHAHVLDFSALSLQINTAFWCLRRVTSGPRSNGFGLFPWPPVFKRSMCYPGINWGFLWSYWKQWINLEEKQTEKTKKRVGYILEKIELLVEKNWMVLMGRGEGRKRQEPGQPSTWKNKMRSCM